jgi:hypothetical protein
LLDRYRTTSHLSQQNGNRTHVRLDSRTVLLPLDDRPSVDHELLVHTINRRAWESVAGWLDHCAAERVLAEPSGECLRSVARHVRDEAARRHG